MISKLLESFFGADEEVGESQYNSPFPHLFWSSSPKPPHFTSGLMGNLPVPEIAVVSDAHHDRPDKEVSAPVESVNAFGTGPVPKAFTDSKKAVSMHGAASSIHAVSTDDTASSRDAGVSAQDPGSKDASSRRTSTDSAGSREPAAALREQLPATPQQLPAAPNNNNSSVFASWSTRFLGLVERLEASARTLEELATVKNWRAPGLPGGRELVAAQTDVENCVREALRMLRKFDFGGEVVVLGPGQSESTEARALLPKAAARCLVGGRVYSTLRPATLLRDVRDILLGDLDGLRDAEYARFSETLENLYESCLPPWGEKYGRRGEDRGSWWWGEQQWRVVGQERVKFVRGSGDDQKNPEIGGEGRLLFLLVGQNGAKKAFVPSAVARSHPRWLSERDFLVRFCVE